MGEGLASSAQVAPAGSAKAGVRVVFLGTGGALNEERYQSSILVDGAGERVLLDVGGGLGVVGRLIAAGVDPYSVTRVFVSHRHLDHSGGLEPFLLWVGIGAYLAAKAPPRLQINATYETARAIQDGWQAVDAAGARRFSGDLWQSVIPGQPLQLNSRATLTAVAVDHLPPGGGAAGCVLDLDGVRIVYSGDTLPSDALAVAAADADLLIHEVGGLDRHAEAVHRPHHSTAGDAGRIASRARVRQMGLFHFPPPRHIDQPALLAEASQFAAGCHVFLSTDGMAVDIDPARA